MAEYIQYSNDPANGLAAFLTERRYSKLCVVTDAHTLEHCYPRIRASMPPHAVVTVPAGEEHKNLETCALLWQAFTDHALDRHAGVVVLGGGVLGDMAGFCAATFKRGVDFILVPTTLLSQVDASVGGKLGIDFNHLKNHIGVFQAPALTLIYTGFLATLPEAELRSGFAEVIKHALIADRAMWDELRTNTFPHHSWEKLVAHSVEIKRKIVEEDPREKGLRKILNAGHTIGHAIETYLLRAGRRVLHGEAVAAGLIAEAFLAVQRGLLREADQKEINNYILRTFGKVSISPNDDEGIAALTVQDKKNSGNKVLCVLLEGPGKARWDCEISLEEVKRALAFYRSA